MAAQAFRRTDGRGQKLAVCIVNPARQRHGGGEIDLRIGIRPISQPAHADDAVAIQKGLEGVVIGAEIQLLPGFPGEDLAVEPADIGHGEVLAAGFRVFRMHQPIDQHPAGGTGIGRSIERQQAGAFDGRGFITRFHPQLAHIGPARCGGGVQRLVKQDDAAAIALAAEHHFPKTIRAAENIGVTEIRRQPLSVRTSAKNDFGLPGHDEIGGGSCELYLLFGNAILHLLGEEDADARAFHQRNGGAGIGAAALVWPCRQILGREKEDRQVPPAQIIRGDGMAPMHGVPAQPVRIMLIKQMRPPLEATETVRVVHPAERRAEVIAAGKLRCGIVRLGMDDGDAGFQHIRRREPVDDGNGGRDRVVTQLHMAAAENLIDSKTELFRVDA